MKIKRLFCSVLFLTFVVGLVSIAHGSEVFAEQIPTDVNIGLFYGSSAVKSINVSADKGFDIYTVNSDGTQPELKIDTDKNISVCYNVSSDEYVILSDKAKELGRVNCDDADYVMVTPISNLKCKTIKIGKKLYRGSMILNTKNVKSGLMNVINKINLEEYLYGVVPSEMPGSWKIEALKAQAIAARTYALKNIGKHSKYGFDLCASTDCQAYNGYSGEYPNSSKAVDQTKGQLIYYKNQLIDAVFFATSGGRTESCENVWSSSVPYLKGVDDKYESKKASYSTWKQEITSEKLKSILKAKKVNIGDILDVKIDSVSTNGRVMSLTITGTEGSKTYKKSSITALLGLKSTCFTISIKKDSIDIQGTSTDSNTSTSVNSEVYDDDSDSTNPIPSIEFTLCISGKGWGHGIGMSQWGAEGMAEAGKNYSEILKHYYTGVTISKYKALKN